MNHCDPDSERSALINGVGYFQAICLSIGLSPEESNPIIQRFDEVSRDDFFERLDGPAREAALLGALASCARLGTMTWPTVRGEYKTRKAQGGARGAKAKATDARRAEIIAVVRRRLVEHPRDSLDYARRRVAEEHEGEPGWSFTSIRRATIGLKKT